MTKLRKNTIKALSFIGAFCLLSGVFLGDFKAGANGFDDASVTPIKLNDAIDDNRKDFYDESVVYKLPDTVQSNDEISLIIMTNTESVMDSYAQSDGKLTITEYVTTKPAKYAAMQVARENQRLINVLNKSGVKYTLGDEYDTIMSGFEISVKAKDFEKVNKLLSADATVIVGEEYAPAETQIVTNEVDVYETGIFDSSSSEYQGDGVVVAILDTGLDYTHSAFSVDNFTTTNTALTLQNVSQKVGQTVAAGFTQGLTGEDVYLNKKVPYAYDYADKDPDVLPINSEHGTHVAGIIAGKDDTITGVAPNAQLAIMKVFSDVSTGAKTSWILSALEDCVILGVDVINMSLGSSCGFTREVDRENINVVYDSILDAGISLIAAASNDYNATFGSDKNGSNGLTSNPDSGTVGSPSTYAASLSVASVNGVKTPYLLSGGDIIYFTEASTSSTTNKHFVDDILATVGGVDEYEFEYVTVPGIGRSSDYSEPDEYYRNKIVLVKRGTTTFEDKVRVALNEKGASGVIIYNNVSGTISMTIGKAAGAVCSIAQDEGEKLAAAERGTIKISRKQVAGPFMSDFSSWGPTSDLKIKPEITAHGGEILSAVPGQGYERLSGTSMAAPNQAGAAALIRQYVKYSGTFGTDLSTKEVTALVNRVMMSTADIVYNKNGLPYAVRKQGAGLININKAVTSASYVTTYEQDGVTAMDKTKIELGDDKTKSGVYEATFSIENVSNKAVSYDISAMIQTEGVSETYTSHGDTTVTQDGYTLGGTTITVNGGDNMTVSVDAKSSQKVTVKITLSDADKKYLDESFKYGMYVEGFIVLKASAGTNVDMHVPVLAFYGDWTQAPIFDEEYYDTHKDEINAGIDPEDKLMADAYATRVIGGLYSDYITTLGTYAFTQDPSATQIAADKDKIAISNQNNDEEVTVNSIYSVSAGLLRNAKEINIKIVEDSTGKLIYDATEYNQMKSYSRGTTIYASHVEVKFGALEHNLKNNTKYTVTLEAFIDYGEKSDQKNVRNKFEFPLYIDFEAPVVTGVTYRKEYDRTTKKTQLFADVDIYDNHYAMGAQFGQIIRNEDTGRLTIKSFGKYITPVYSQFNSTSTVTFDLTDHVAQIKKSVGSNYTSPNGGMVYNNNSFIVTCYDYAQNSAMYEISLPDDVLSMYFSEDSVSLSPNETLDIGDILNIYPEESWLQTLDFSSSDSNIISIVNQTVIAKNSGTATLTAVGADSDGKKVEASIQIKVLAPGEEGYNGGYTVPEVNKFSLTSYEVIKAYYSTVSSEREIGFTGGIYQFGSSQNLSMYPSESVKLAYSLDSYFPERTAVTYKSGNERIATVTADGTIVAQAEGSTIITVGVTFDGRTTLYSERVSITVKDPFITNSIYFTAYRGLGGTVTIPSDRGVTTINAYAFCGYELVDKDPDNGDVINDEDPYFTKQMYLGDDTITKIIIPDGVTTIEEYAFANLTALEEVVLPETLNKIGLGAFYGCNKLKKINLESVKFINERAFFGCALENVDLSSVVAIGNYTFANCKLSYVVLPMSSQSLGTGAFAKNKYLTSVEFKASKIKIGSDVFSDCTQLSSIDINAAVISSYAFKGCSELSRVNFGRDVSVIGEFAFAGTKVSAFTLDARNRNLTLKAGGALVYKGDELLLAAPQYSGGAYATVTLDDTTKSIGNGAFAGNAAISRVVANSVERVGAYAFALCSSLSLVTMNSVEEIGDFAFAMTDITATPNLENVKSIGNSAFYNTAISSVTVADGTVIGDAAFAYCPNLKTATLGNNVKIGARAFFCPYDLYSLEYAEDLSNYDFNLFYTHYEYELRDLSGNVVRKLHYYSYNYNLGIYSALTTVTIGDNCEIGTRAFAWTSIENLTLGDNAVIGDYAFYSVAGIGNLDLSTAKKIGEGAFSGFRFVDLWCEDNVWYFANEMISIGGKEYTLGRIYTSMAPAIEQVDLSGLTELGEGAFANNYVLTQVTLGDGITEIADSAFYNDVSLASITLSDGITKIGAGAFANTALEEINLNKVEIIGENAFMGSPLSSVELKDGVEIGEGAFADCSLLEEVINLKNASSIGAYAFMYTSLTEVDLSGVTTVGDYAFSNSYVTKVILGEKLVSFGENPFYNCEIATFGKVEEVKFGNNVVGETLTDTYDVSETVKVIGGVLYQVVPNGLELVSYPFSATANSYVVEDGTVRISAYAFANNQYLQSVTLPLSLKSLGDKAFYGCSKLSLVVFKSYQAPILEEEYNEDYALLTNLPLTGYYVTVSGNVYQGLAISPYYMWNLSNTNFYYGANFVNYVGKVSNNLVMVKPSNGQGYDTFILSQYFGTTVQGSAATTEATEKVKDMIDALPSDITLDDEDAVRAARAAFDALPLVQQALVDNYKVLTDAEATITYLKSLQPAPEEPEVKENGFVKFLKNNYVGLIIAAVCLAALAAYIVVTQVKGKKKSSGSADEAAEAAEATEEKPAPTGTTEEKPAPETKSEKSETKSEEKAEETPAETKPKKTQAKKSKTKKSEVKPDTTEKDEKDI